MGLPSMLLCIEMVPISLLLVYAYNAGPYFIRRPRNDDSAREELQQAGVLRTYQGGFLGWKVLVAILDPKETLQAILFAVKLLIYKTDQAPVPLANHNPGGSQQNSYRL